MNGHQHQQPHYQSSDPDIKKGSIVVVRAFNGEHLEYKGKVDEWFPQTQQLQITNGFFSHSNVHKSQIANLLNLRLNLLNSD